MSEKVRYQIATYTGSVIFREGWPVGAFAIAEVPGLMWSVDHLGTGMRARTLMNLDDAVLYALELNANADWSFTDCHGHLSALHKRAHASAIQAVKDRWNVDDE